MSVSYIWRIENVIGELPIDVHFTLDDDDSMRQVVKTAVNRIRKGKHHIVAQRVETEVL